VGLEILRPCSCNLSGYLAVRGSLLYGRGRLRNSFAVADTTEVYDGGGNVTTEFVSTTLGSSQDTGGYDLLPIVELDAGAQWSRNVGNSQFFLRPSIVSQTYFDGGSATSRTGNFGLFGVAIGAGINY
jgi:hypothetical protein